MGTLDLKIPHNASSSSEALANLPARACCVVVEYVPGGTLKNLLFKNRKKKLAFKVVVQLALDLARGWASILLCLSKTSLVTITTIHYLSSYFAD